MNKEITIEYLRDYVNMLADEIKESFETEANTDVYDMIHEAADSNEFVIYPANARALVSIVSKGEEEAAFDDVQDLGGFCELDGSPVQSMDRIYVLLAYSIIKNRLDAELSDLICVS